MERSEFGKFSRGRRGFDRLFGFLFPFGGLGAGGGGGEGSGLFFFRLLLFGRLGLVLLPPLPFSSPLRISGGAPRKLCGGSGARRAASPPPGLRRMREPPLRSSAPRGPGRTDGRTDGWTDGRTDTRMEKWTCGRTAGQEDGQMDGKPCGHGNGWTDGRTDGRIGQSGRQAAPQDRHPPAQSARVGDAAGRGAAVPKSQCLTPGHLAGDGTQWGRGASRVPRVSHGCPVQLRTPGLAQEWGTWSCMGAAMGRSRCRLHGNVAPLDPRSISPPPPAALHPSHPLHGEGRGGGSPPPPHPIPTQGSRRKAHGSPRPMEVL